MLFVVATPIGNLDDITKRALQILESCDAILCEDTRRSSILLNHYGIKKPLLSYHKFNEKQFLEKVITDLETGRNLALISDAGTPCINDPGQILVQACLEKGLAVNVIPGACSVIAALVMSGFDTSRFQFLGFLPKKQEALKRALHQAVSYPGTTVAFESPERLVETLEVLEQDQRVAVIREMTKTFEECRRGRAAEVLAHFKAHPPRGEIVIVIAGGKTPDDCTLEELVQMLREFHGLSLKEAIKEAARMKDLPKRDVYREFHGI